VVIVRLNGRLGNQLFIWALSLYLQKEAGKKVYIACNSIQDTHPLMRTLAYSSNQKIVACRVIVRFLSLLDLAKSKFSLFSRTLVALGVFWEDQSKELDIERLLKSRIVMGYFQRSWIVKQNEHQIKTLLLESLKSTTGAPKALDYKIPIIHVRRGDYQRAPKQWGLLSIDYYLDALKEKSKTYCFTDLYRNEIPNSWFKRGLEVFTASEVSEMETLWHFSQSTRLMIANSSFSWWGGYLAGMNISLVQGQ
jgi:hypothetical protein